MPPRHHRTVDRISQIVEAVSRSPHGMTLAELSGKLQAPKSSVHQLLNGLSATGYVVEHAGRFSLGPAPFVLTLLGNQVAAQQIDHDVFLRLSQRIRCSVAVGIRVGDALIQIDCAGDDPALEFTARVHSRRSLVAAAAGKILLAALPVTEMDQLLLDLSPHEEEHVQTFLAELPEIRRTGLAYNRSVTVPGLHAVATAYRNSSGEFVASVSAIGRGKLEPRLVRVGRSMQRFLLAERGNVESSPRTA